MCLRWLGFFLVLVTATAFADEQVRQVQEELRKRNLYFGDVDGQATPELANAIKRYQARKGFTVTGTIDVETATSLDVQPRIASARQPPALPDVPVLRSDRARELPQEQRAVLEQKAEENPDAVATPPPPAESPPPTQEVDAQSIKALIKQYLADSEGFDLAAQTRYFAYPVEYFDHGTVSAGFVDKDVANYVKRWPERKYQLQEPVRIAPATKDGEMQVEFPITFDVRNNKHVAKGRTRNFWTVRREGGDLKIVAIREQRLRE
jgi:hypothetical protein